MGELKKYRVTVNGNETVMKLTAKDAERYEDAEAIEETPAKARKTQNKARAAQNKKADDDGGSADVH